MYKLTFLGAGSTVFLKNLVGDIILTPEINEFELALYDIDGKRLTESYDLICLLNRKYGGRAAVKKYLGEDEREEALRGADFVVNSVQIGGYRPATVADFEIPKKYGLRQTIGDTLGIGGIFRALRTYPFLEGVAEQMARVCPRAFFLNYTNPMAMLTGYMLRHLGLKGVGLCHSVQVCVPMLLERLDMDKEDVGDHTIAGINHQAWLLSVKDRAGRDLYPEIRRRANLPEYREKIAGEHPDLVRMKILSTFGYYNTESSEHTAEYSPYFIKRAYPQLIDEYRIPLDEYPRRCENQIADWDRMRGALLSGETLEHVKSVEYASRIISAVLNGGEYRFNGNVLNEGLIDNLPREACVEVPCTASRAGIVPAAVGKLPEQLAALNRTNINPQLIAVEAGISRRKKDVYRAALLDPHTSSELSIDEVIAMCDELFEAHRAYLPTYR